MIEGDRVLVVADTFHYNPRSDWHYGEHIGKEGVLTEVRVGMISDSVTHRVDFPDGGYDYFNQNELEVIK